MEITTLVPVLLPVVLFIITLIIILVTREQDNRKRGVERVRKLTDQLKSDIVAQQDEFRAQIIEIEERVQAKDNQIQQMFQELDKQLKKVESYSEDLGKMRVAMETYREALCGLAKLTQDADNKITQVEDDVEKLEDVRKIIDGFKLDMKDADEHLKHHEGLVIQMERDTMNRLEDRCKSLSEDFSVKIGRFCDQLDMKVETARDATENLMNEGAAVLGNIGDRTAEQMQLSSQIRELYRQKERLLGDIGTLNRKVVEKQSEIAQPIADGPVDEPEDLVEDPVFTSDSTPLEPLEVVHEDTEVPFDEPEDVHLEEKKDEYDGEVEEIVFD